jgi:uncharacterized protein (DUF1499 family)
MKTALITLSLLLVAFVVLFFILGMISKSGKAPGLIDGRLSECPDKPNCVCSEHKTASHYIEPVNIPDDITFDTVHVLKDVVQEMGGNIQVENDTYIAATFTSALFGFMDDMEIRIDSIQKVIHIRSASRVGHSDMGVNRERTELLKSLYRKKVSEQASH